MAPITPKNLLKHEFVGLHVEVVKSADSRILGMRGLVVDETKNMIHIHDGKRMRKVSKEISTFRFRLPDKRIVWVDGKCIVNRPEDRLKMRMRLW
jgi:ribonuclease P protein subunit POP4